MPLVEGGALTLFNGVSRQPPAVRLPSQVQEGINAHFSVETGGFSKRAGAESVAVGVSPVPGGEFGVHFIDRDPTERYSVLSTPLGLQVNSLLDGTARTITYEDAGLAYVTAGNPALDLAFVTIADFTFVVNRSITVLANTVDETPAGTNAAVITVKQSVGTYSVVINGGAAVTGTFTSSDTPGVSASVLAVDIQASFAGPTWIVTSVDNYVFIRRLDNAAFTIDVQDGGGYTALVTDFLSDAADLPAKAVDDMVVEIGATRGQGYFLRFEETLAGSGKGVWRETAEPGVALGLDHATMPHVLVRNGDSTFTLRQADWNNRVVGDLVSAPDPEFVGKKISEIAYFRNRLALIAGETVRFSAAGDYFNFYPEQTTQVVDSDSFAVSASGTSVALLRWAVPFRRTLFVSSSNAQFEVVTPDILTPGNTAMDASTSYEIQQTVRPLVVGDSLFMAATIGNSTALLEYSYDQARQTSTAAEVTKHIRGYIPPRVIAMAGDGVTGTVALLPDGEPRNVIYVYTTFSQGTEKAQSAFHKWTLNVDRIYGIAVIEGQVYILAQKNGSELHTVRINTAADTPVFYPFAPLLDFWIEVEGTYDEEADRTSFTLPYSVVSTFVGTEELLREDGTPYLREGGVDLLREADGSRLLCLPSTSFGGLGIPDLIVDEDDPYTVQLEGDWTAGPIIIGEGVEFVVELSPVYMRSEQGAAMHEGRLQLRRFGLKYEDSVYFRVDVTADARETRYWQFDARNVGFADTSVGGLSPRSGLFRFSPNTEGQTCRIVITNNTQLPTTIVSTTWTGLHSTLHHKD